MSAPRRRPQLAFAAAALLGLLPWPAPAQAQEPERGIYEIAAAGAPQRTTTRVVLLDGRLLLPLHEVLLQTGIPGERAGPRWTFQWPPPSFSAELDPATGEYRRGAERGQLPAGSWILADDVLHLDSAALGLLLGAELRTDHSALQAVLSHPGGFPAQRLLQEQQRRAARLRDPLRQRAGVHVPYPGATGGIALNWDASTLVRERDTFGVLRGVLGMSVLGGALEVGGSTGLGVDLGDSERLARYVRPFPTNPWIQQVSLGSVVSPTPVPRFLDGIYLSNAPFIPPTDFQEIAYRPALPPGWTAEVYEGETLLGVVTAQDPGSVDLPVGYGFTPVRIRMVGPAGQERTEQLQYIVPSSRLPSRRVEYNLGFGNCRNSACDRYGFADLSRGFAPWLTAGLGAGYLESGDTTRVRPYAAFSVNPLPNLAFDAHAEGSSHARAALQYLGSRNQSLSASLAWFDPDDATLALAGTYATLSTSLYLLRRFLTASGQLRVAPGGALGEGQLYTGMPLGRGYVGTQWYRNPAGPDLLGARAFWRTGRLPALRRELNLGASASFSREGFDIAELTLNFQPQRVAALNAALQWRPEAGTTSFNLTYTVRTGAGLAQARSVVTERDPHLLLGMSGGVALWPGSAATSYNGAVGRAGLSGTVFLDENGNGRFDDGERPVPGIPLLAEGLATVSGADGEYRIWDLNPVRTTRVWVDSLHVADARLAPVRPEYLLRLPANTFTRLDIPIVRTTEVSGRVTMAGRSALGGIAINLRSADGALLLQTRSFSDGEFYFPRVAPGRYTVEVANASLDALDAFAEPLVVDIRANGRRARPLTDLVLLSRDRNSLDWIQPSGIRTIAPASAAPLHGNGSGWRRQPRPPSGNRTSGRPGANPLNSCLTDVYGESCRGNESRPGAPVSTWGPGPRVRPLPAGASDAPRRHSRFDLADLGRILGESGGRTAGDSVGHRLGYDHCVSIDPLRFECSSGEREIVRRGMGERDEPRRAPREYPAAPERRRTPRIRRAARLLP